RHSPSSISTLGCLALPLLPSLLFVFSFTVPAPTENPTLSLHDALPICNADAEAKLAIRISADGSFEDVQRFATQAGESLRVAARSEEHTSELQSLTNLVCRLLLEKKKATQTQPPPCQPAPQPRTASHAT